MIDVTIKLPNKSKLKDYRLIKFEDIRRLIEALQEHLSDQDQNDPIIEELNSFIDYNYVRSSIDGCNDSMYCEDTLTFRKLK